MAGCLKYSAIKASVETACSKLSMELITLGSSVEPNFWAIVYLLLFSFASVNLRYLMDVMNARQKNRAANMPMENFLLRM
ncbi:hypothetical protein D3C86_1795690 [compost metagenome]